MLHLYKKKRVITVITHSSTVTAAGTGAVGGEIFIVLAYVS